MWQEDNEAECWQGKPLPSAVSTDDCSTAASNDEGGVSDTPGVTSDEDDEALRSNGRAESSPPPHGSVWRPSWLRVFSCCQRRAPKPTKLSEYPSTTAMPMRGAQAHSRCLKQRAVTLPQETVHSATPSRSCASVAPKQAEAPVGAARRVQGSPTNEPTTIARMLPELSAMPLPIVHPPPGLPPPSTANLLSMRGADPAAAAGFDVARFRKTLVGIMRDLASSRNVAEAVRRVRAEAVPVERHATEFTDVVTRALEEFRGPVRRSFIAFAAGLAVASPSAFDRAQCMIGLSMFFKDIYSDLCSEVAHLPSIIQNEFKPAMLTVFPRSLLDGILPTAC
mmetsp:Transcript_36637/g.67162  ORF Transcript_36637/g.67162 Transcript_36637/m.67162 type:complete len:337 (-) Transcript_36637:239-1249(-)